MALIYLYDGSETGFFTAVFTAYERKERPDGIAEKGARQAAMDEREFFVFTDEEKADRVKNKLKDLGGGVLSDVRCGLRSCKENAEKIIFDYIGICLKHGATAIERQSDGAVFAFSALLSAVRLEAHRFTGFLRFSETAEGYFYAHYAPDNDVTALLLPHFTARYAGIPFLIHDVKRNLLAFFNGSTTRIVQGEGQITVLLSEREETFSSLWRSYYDAVNIEARKNERQMRQYMPRRYWSHLPEKEERRKG